MKPSRTAILLAAGYVVALHVLVVVLVWKTDIYHRVSQRLGFSTGGLFSLDARTYRSANATLDRIDAMMRLSPVVLFGDSRTQDIPADLLPRESLNLGIGGLTISNLTTSIKRYPSLGKASAVVLAIGVIDACAAVDSSEASSRLMKLANELPTEVRLVWSAVLPVDPTPHEGACRVAPAAIRAINQSIAELCAARPGCTYSDASPSLSAADGTLAKEFHAGDGLHLNRLGYEKWLERLNADISRARSKGP